MVVNNHEENNNLTIVGEHILGKHMEGLIAQFTSHEWDFLRFFAPKKDQEKSSTLHLPPTSKSGK